jgi:hypothetical protein
MIRIEMMINKLKMEGTTMEKLRNELLGAQMRLEREEKRAHEKEQKVAEKEADRTRKADLGLRRRPRRMRRRDY